MADIEKTVTFVEFQEPKLKAGSYSLKAQLTAGPKKTGTTEPTNFTEVVRRFAVLGPRFQLGGDDLVSLFPPPNANGEFTGVLPHAVLARPTLPWLRDCIPQHGFANVPWLAVLTLQEDEIVLPERQDTPVVRMTVADLVHFNTQIKVEGTPHPGWLGQMPDGTVSYPGMDNLDYGEAATDPVDFIDLDVKLFSRIAPTATDLPLLANVRVTDTYDSVDNKDTYITRGIVLGNRVGRVGGKAMAFLVSLENLGPFLPDDNGNPSGQFGTAKTIRLTVLASWRFSVNDGGESLTALLRNFNTDRITTVRMPGATVDPVKVKQAAIDEATGITTSDGDAMAANALAAGFVPLAHHLREAGQTVSWYRGPLLPYGGVRPYPFSPVSTPDALLRYDPQMGMFDVSYAAAWQLGQLLGLASRAFSIALFQWKQQFARFQVIAAQQDALHARVNPNGLALDEVPLASFFRRMQANREADAPDPPQAVTDFIAALRRLDGVPFSYLVPDERMLPTESLRIFTLDPNWVEAIVDGALSIGRTSETQRLRDVGLGKIVRPLSIRAARMARPNNRPHLARLKAEAGGSDKPITGVLIRSQAIRGWPTLQIDGYSKPDDTKPPDVAKLRMVHLSSDVLLCLFDGIVEMISIHEPPEQLHSGFEFYGGQPKTTMREIKGAEPGHQYPVEPNGLAPINLRADKLTMQALDSGQSIKNQLNTYFNQGIATMTSNEFALEMVKGVVRVEYLVGKS